MSSAAGFFDDIDDLMADLDSDKIDHIKDEEPKPPVEEEGGSGGKLLVRKKSVTFKDESKPPSRPRKKSIKISVSKQQKPEPTPEPSILVQKPHESFTEEERDIILKYCNEIELCKDNAAQVAAIAEKLITLCEQY
eukprot:TRINITY_DN6711_c0_g1_i1.p1 TRINITY_DN6711_c0_g1~~TRINITY_DN6711_c0_g1_i1.p1  ORF type:complete len:136 (+),score=31.89 TRINITY_DN6711_c0_g1_i1:54-461(+)